MSSEKFHDEPSVRVPNQDLQAGPEATQEVAATVEAACTDEPENAPTTIQEGNQKFAEEPSVRAPNPDTGAAPANNPKSSGTVDATRTDGSAAPITPKTHREEPNAVLSLLRPGYLLTGENADEFERLRAAIFAARKPTDAIEEILMLEAAQLTWEGAREARLGAQRFKALAYEKLKTFLGSLGDKARELWMRHPEGGSFAEHALLKHACNLDDVLSATLADHADEFEKLLRMRLAKYSQRNANLLEVDRHRVANDTFVEAESPAKALDRPPRIDAPAGEGAPALDAETEGATLVENSPADGEATDGQ